MFVAALLALAGCNPHMYDDVPALHDVKPAEVPGTWVGYDRTNVVLRPDGKADIRLLDGQGWDFDDKWRLSGTGTWKLTDQPTGWNDGQHVQLTLTSRTAVAADRLQGPKTYTWTFDLERDDKEALTLYFFFGDPDSRSRYILEREEP